MTTTTTRKPKRKKARYFIVNPAGAIHEVTRDLAAVRLRQPGYRKATRAEVGALIEAKGFQRAGRPLATIWNPEPEPLELDD